MIFLKNFIHDEEGQDLVEYALLLGFVALGATAVLSSLSGGIGGLFTSATTKLNAAALTPAP